MDFTAERPGIRQLLSGISEYSFPGIGCAVIFCRPVFFRGVDHHLIPAAVIPEIHAGMAFFLIQENIPSFKPGAGLDVDLLCHFRKTVRQIILRDSG